MMTNEEIKKALEMCADWAGCDDCPYIDGKYKTCVEGQLHKDALILITEQEKENERLKAENEELTKVVSSKVYDLIDNTKEIADAREAWEQQAKTDVLNELKKKIHDTRLNDDTAEIIIEMIEELQNAENKS